MNSLGLGEKEASWYPPMPYRQRRISSKDHDVKKCPAPTPDKISKIRELLKLKS